MKESARLDIRPFALPNTPANEVWFEQSRDIQEVAITLRRGTTGKAGLSYRKKHWPQHRFELLAGMENPGIFGWQPMDDWFNAEWRPAKIAPTAVATG